MKNSKKIKKNTLKYVFAIDNHSQIWYNSGMKSGSPVSYSDWLKKNNLKETSDYNLHDAYLAGLKPDERGHLPDTFKLPNHITYSEDSVYSKQEGAPPAGRWDKVGKKGKKWMFWASPTNIENAGGADKLDKYFKEYEPDSILILPPQPSLKDILLQR